MLCESQPPVSCAGAKAHSLSARALLLDALGTVARYATAPIASSLISHALGTVARTQLHPSPRLSSLSHWVQSLAEQPHPPPRLSSLSHRAQLHAEQPHPPPHLISSLSPALPHAPSYVALSPAPHLAPPCYPYYTYTSLVAKYVLFCVAYALVCAGRAVLYVHARRP